MLLLAACTHAGSSSPSGDTGGFRVFYPTARDACAAGPCAFTLKSKSRMQAKPAAACRYDNGRDAKWANTGARVADGALPPGLALEDGAIAGAPSAAGDYHVTIMFTGVTCAGKPQPDQRVDVPITVN